MLKLVIYQPTDIRYHPPTRLWRDTMQRSFFVTAVFVLPIVFVLNGCFRPYKIDIQQGNFVTAQQLKQLKSGMTKREVRYVLGTPMIADPFHENRWDYYYYLRSNKSKTPEHRRITIVFNNDALQEIQGDVVAQGVSESEGTEESSTGGTKVTEPRAEKKTGLFRRAWDKVFSD